MYLVVGLDIELNLLASEGSYSVVVSACALLSIPPTHPVVIKTYLICILPVLHLLARWRLSQKCRGYSCGKLGEARWSVSGGCERELVS
jgi:hypothetical protein